MASLKWLGVLLVAIALSAQVASADVLNASQFTNGAVYQTIYGAKYNIVLEAYPRGFTVSNFFGKQGVGISGGIAPAEIDTSGYEYVMVNYSVPQKVSEIVLLDLFPAGLSDPEVAPEQAIIRYWKEGVPTAFEASLTADGARTDLGPVSYAGSGEWHLLDPFGNANITAIKFMAGRDFFTGCPIDACASDYALSSITSTPVPEPSSIVLLGAVLLGAGAAARRRFAK